MNKTGGLLTIMAIALALAGCSASPETPPTAETTAPASASASTTPKVMSLKANADETSASAANTELFLKDIDNRKWYGNRVSEADLISYGKEACERMESGDAGPSVLPGTTKSDQIDNVTVISAAQNFLCPGVND